MPSEKTSIVIIGAGAAGATIARSLSGSLNASQHDIILISPHPYHILRPASIRMVVTNANKLEDQVLVPLDKVFLKGNGRFVQGEVARIDEQGREVELTTGKKVSFDFLVLATGTKWGGPIALPLEPSKVQGFIDEKRREFKTAKNILLVGGGSVGIELAGELRDLSPDTEITIVHREKLLLNSTYPDKMRKYIQEQLEGRQIKVIVGDSVDAPTPGPHKGTITTSRGKRLSPDLIVHAWGGRPNTEVIAASLGSDVLTERGLVKVKPTMQLEGRTNIFAAGDIVNWEEQKMIMKAQGHGAVVVKNIISLLAGKPTKAVYKGSMEAIIVTNGKESGVSYLPFLWGLVFGSWFSAMVKSKGLMISMGRSTVGY
ncbi:hypothetical protein V5O48_000513 [Marasmius crinis-equi]|uniref:FAD/NAD(P)-binding domain-containing protein n=1 Tax=Marasmius crinis-equi TaxID=585013 RepID=A0ABR3G175_9AGAR